MGHKELFSVHAETTGRMEATEMLGLVERTISSVRFVPEGRSSAESPTIVDRAVVRLHLAGTLIAEKAGMTHASERHYEIARTISPDAVDKFYGFSHDKQYYHLFRNISTLDHTDLRLPHYLAEQIDDPVLKLRCRATLSKLNDNTPFRFVPRSELRAA